jgi:methanogenic corrinoid protein MtbC1
LIDSGTVPHLDPAVVRLALDGASAASDGSQPDQQLKQLLIDGDQAGSQRVILEAFETGGMTRVADSLIAPAMKGVGIDWQTGKIDVMHEHRATEICTSILYQIVPMTEGSIDDQSRIAVGCAPTDDYHQIASLLAQMLLAEAGWRAKSLGGGVSSHQLELAVQEHQADVAWISVTNIPSIDDLIEEFAPAVSRITSNGTVVLIGGQGIDSETVRRLGATAMGHHLTDLVHLAGSPKRA